MTKVCSQCGRELALEGFARQANGLHGRKSWCRDCQAEYRRAYYEANRERENQQCREHYWRDPEAMRERNKRYADERYAVQRAEREAQLAWERAEQRKRCPRCDSIKGFDEFYADPRRRHGLNTWCKACFRAHCRATYDPEIARQRARRRREQPGAQERERRKTREWRAANPEHARRLTLDYQHRRRDQARGGPVDYDAVLAEHGRVCHICGGAIEGGLQFDHMVPLSRGGSHSADNVRPAHGRCNRWKGDRLMGELEWVA